ncbi:MAG: hypothetical protein Q4A32_01815 [Lachnospiraceae bacterium]|nr:hypothetical protein [Lachnospiraceae bacterium]
MQVEKHSLCDRNIELDEFLGAFQKKIEEALFAEKIDQSEIEFCVCWNLSGSDILILSRTKRLKIVYEIISFLQKDGITIHGKDGEKNVSVFSFSSHCAFPCDGRATSENSVSGYYVDRNAVIDWLRDEDENFSMISFVETAHNYDGIVYGNSSYQILFGERDYRLRLSKDNVEQLADVIVDRLNDQKAASGGVYQFRSSYLVPGIFVNRSGQGEQGKTNLQDSTFPEDTLKEEETYRIYRNLKERFDAVNHIVCTREDVFGKSMPDSLHPTSQQIFYCTNSLLGILKYAMRLQATINQYDLYCYIRKLYIGFDCAVARYEEKITGLSREDAPGDNHDYLRKYVSDLVVQSMGFVSELQHLFAVLALSPHNYMETYSSSMRSLNAASKLWGAYCGMIEKIASLFQEEIGGKTQECTVMLSPYRECKSQNSMFLSAFAEEKTFVLLQMNFALMFKPQMAVFMIAHECGHHFSDHCREKRFELMTKAYFSHVLEAVFRPFYTAPLHLLNSVEDREEGGEEAKKNKYQEYLGLIEKAEKDEDDYRSLLGIHLFNDMTRDELRATYDKWRTQLMTGYRRDFTKIINALFLVFKTNYDMGNDGTWKSRHFFGEVLEDSYKHAGPDYTELSLEGIAYEISKRNLLFVEGLLKDNVNDQFLFDLNQMARLCAYWSDRHADEKNKEIMAEGVNLKFDKVSRETVMLFREIYADIFAVLVLGMSPDDYEAVILAFADEYEPLLNNPITIRRLYAVFDAVYGGGDGLLDWIKSDECLYAKDVREVALEELYKLESSITKEYICKYGRECAIKLNEKIEAIKAIPNGGLEALEKMRSLALYKEDGRFIDSLWYFWKGAMTS